MDDLTVIAETNDYLLTTKAVDGADTYVILNKKWGVVEGSVDQLPTALDLLTKLQEYLLKSLTDNKNEMDTEQVLTM